MISQDEFSSGALRNQVLAADLSLELILFCSPTFQGHSSRLWYVADGLPRLDENTTLGDAHSHSLLICSVDVRSFSSSGRSRCQTLSNECGSELDYEHGT